MPRAPESRPKGIPMAEKHRRNNREFKKPKQNKAKVVVSPSAVASVYANATKRAVPGKRK
jgi:hypothetical protein